MYVSHIPTASPQQQQQQQHPQLLTTKRGHAANNGSSAVPTTAIGQREVNQPTLDFTTGSDMWVMRFRDLEHRMTLLEQIVIGQRQTIELLLNLQKMQQESAAAAASAATQAASSLAAARRFVQPSSSSFSPSDAVEGRGEDDEGKEVRAVDATGHGKNNSSIGEESPSAPKEIRQNHPLGAKTTGDRRSSTVDETVTAPPERAAHHRLLQQQQQPWRAVDGKEDVAPEDGPAALFLNRSRWAV